MTAIAILGVGCSGSPVRPLASLPEATTHLSPAAWRQVTGWQDDTLIGATSALKRNCLSTARRVDWQKICAAVQQLDELNVAAARVFFETYFVPYQLANSDGTLDGLVTGYYEPLLRGSRTRKGLYQHALYSWPAQYRTTSKVLPARAQLERSGVLNGNELVWVDDPIEAFFLQVQGSGRVLLDNGDVMRVGYGGTNNQPYRSIGTWLLEHGELTVGQATMQGIKAWARAHPARVRTLLDTNPRFVFFREMPVTKTWAATEGPIGALGVPLTSERSIAVDPTAIPLGTPVFLQTTRPLSEMPLNRLVFAQDKGSAIKGQIRADYFWGTGDDAGEMAGRMKQTGQMWLLLPRS